MKRMDHSDTEVYLVNTGWSGGAYGEGGERFNIPVTRAVVNAVLNGTIKDAEFETIPHFKLAIPTSLPDVDSNLLNPRNAWQDKAAHDAKAKVLVEKFQQNFKQYHVSDAIRHAGPELD